MIGQLSIEDAYRKWSEDLVRYACALVGTDDALDLVSEAFSAVLSRGDAEWERVRDPRAYLFRTVLNAARMRERGRSRRERRERATSLTWMPGELLADPAVVRAVNTLTAQQRAVTFLTYWEDLRPFEVAAILGTSEGSVKRQLARARSSLRKVL